MEVKPKNLEEEEVINSDPPTKTRRKQKPRRSRRKTRKSSTDASTSASSSAVSNSETSASETDGSSSDSAPPKRRSKKKTRNNKALLNVLRRHEKILQKLTESQQNDDELSELVNGLSRNTLKNALKDGSKHTSLDHSEPLGMPKLKKKGASASQVKEASMALKEAYKTPLHGNEGGIVRELYQYAVQLAEKADFNKTQFLNLLRTRVATESNLGKYVRTALRTEMSLSQFTQGLEAFFGQEESYLSALRKYQRFTGKNQTANEFISQLRQLSADLVERQTGHYSDRQVLSRMRDLFFKILPSLGETILNYEKLGGKIPTTTSEFASVLLAFRTNIENQLKHTKTVNLVITDSEETEKDGPSQVPDKISATAVNLVQPAPTNQPRTLKLTSAQLQRLKSVCYKCAGKSPVQAPDHKGSGCLLYQGRALASYICSQCKLGVHLNADCLQAEGKQDDLAKRVKELGLPVNMGEVQVQLIDEESKNA